MGIINYILRRIIENSKYNIFNICPMYFLDNYLNKFKSVKEQVVDNDFFGEKQKLVYMELFALSQKHYYAFCKFAKMFKSRKCTYFDSKTDLCMNNLDIFPESQKITLMHFNKKYIFRLTDLINIWKTSLKKNFNLTPRPRYPFNPYINKPFRKYHLYLIYFKLLKSNIRIPIILQIFFNLEFNLTNFEFEMYTELKDYAIENYIDESNDTTLLFEIINMVESLKRHLNNAYIDSQLPRNCSKIVIKLLKPFLKEYFYGKYSCNPLKNEICLSTAINGLKCFFSREPTFGTLTYFNLPNPLYLLNESEEEEMKEDSDDELSEL
jgi:hypothetical protein